MKARLGEPVLISWDDATTLFHEFGHALHGLAANVSYPALSGTAVPRDYVEFPRSCSSTSSRRPKSSGDGTRGSRRS